MIFVIKKGAGKKHEAIVENTIVEIIEPDYDFFKHLTTCCNALGLTGKYQSIAKSIKKTGYFDNEHYQIERRNLK